MNKYRLFSMYISQIYRKRNICWLHTNSIKIYFSRKIWESVDNNNNNLLYLPIRISKQLASLYGLRVHNKYLITRIKTSTNDFLNTNINLKLNRVNNK